MGATILDALIAQARGAISRAYMVAGLAPALATELGWQLYDARSLANLQQRLEPLFTLRTAAVPAGLLVQVVLVAVLGALFYGGRGLVLRLLQDGPHGTLSFVRQLMIELQIKRWWKRRRSQARAEQDRTVLKSIVDGVVTYYDRDLRVGYSSGAPLDASRAARQYVEQLARMPAPGGWLYGPIDRRPVTLGLRDFYSTPVEDRTSEQRHWTELYATEHGGFILDRLSADAFRWQVEATASAQEQPESERQLAPTQLGNRVAALDDYAETRYCIATSVLWTRLWGVLGQAERQEISNAQLRVEMLANMTLAFALTGLGAVVCSVYRSLLAVGAILVWDPWTIAFAAGCLALTMGSYRTAVFAFGGVADGIIRLVDLHRVRVLMTFGLAQPATFAEERAMFKELAEFFGNGVFANLSKRSLERGKGPKVG